ncbi:LAQU0S03e03972g1_1 [Lachancea quebecensis]|uniref:AP-1 complex subunit gamma n=1 Tax=Lachancea quebecensis TaxID=1654605 RepID=A0A0N7ML75_9SACH|nr:LAQU0S03e03972g1_1 [Lachancea quebecensis]
MGSLRSFIKDVRAAKTLAEERSIVTKESARIRTKLKDDHLPQEKRRKNIHKLLYLHILGEKTHFAQVECINLIASEDFRDKRLGYLAAMILLDENQEILTLLTNMLNNDLNHPNRYVVSLALSTLGSLMSPELARDLYSDVENILAHSKDDFLVKKALQCAAKLIQRDASLVEVFHSYISSRLVSNQPSSHGVLLGVAKLCQATIAAKEMYEYDNYPEILQSMIQSVPEFFALLQDMNSTNFNPEHDVAGTCDPFLQVELLYTIRLLFELAPHETESYKDKLNDLLTKIATNSDGTKNSAHAVLYECVRTIFALQLDQSLKVLGVNVLAKFLSGKDNNTKYVALNTLLHVVPQEPQAVQKHRKFISKCLFDPDISIKTRAVELTFAILNNSNIKELIEELIAFLKLTSEDEKDLVAYVVEHIIGLFEQYKLGNEKWALEATVNMLMIVGEHISLEKLSDILIMINNAQDLNHKVQIIRRILDISFAKSEESVSSANVGWKLVSAWCVGEYGDTLLENNIYLDTELTEYLRTLDGLYSDDYRITGYVLTAALKLSSRLQNPSCIEELRQIIKGHTKDTNLMIQTKSVQYAILFNLPAKEKHDILGAMPLFEKKAKNGVPAAGSKPEVKRQEPDLLLELLDDDYPKKNTASNTAGSLLDIFGSAPQGPAETENGKDSESLGPSQNSVTIPEDALEAFQSTDLDVHMKLKSIDDYEAHVEMFIHANASINSLQVLAAVSKSKKLTLGNLSATTLAPGENCCQEMKITGGGKPKLRIKLTFNTGSPSITTTEQFDYKFEQKL